MSGNAGGSERDATEEYDQIEVIEMLLDAHEREDDEAIREWSRRLAPPADALIASKSVLGADHIREKGYITRFAEKKYGKDWLEKSDEELLEMRIRLGPGD